MPQANLQVQLGSQHLEFISRYKITHAVATEAIVVQRALELLEQTELESAYKIMATNKTRESEALEWAEATILDISNETR